MNEIELVGAEAAATHAGSSPQDGKAPREHSWLFGLLIAPSAATANGVIQGGVLAYLLSLQHIGSGGQAHLLAILGIPTWLYFVWSPITDFFVKRRTWLLLGGVLAGVLMNFAFHEPRLTGSSAVVLMFVSAALSQLVVSSCGGMMSALRRDETRRAASSFYQAGSLGFGALSAWLLLYMSSRLSPGALGWLANALISLPALAALAAPAQQSFGQGSFGQALRQVGVEFQRSFKSWRALPYVLCMLFPGASGAAIGLLPGVAAGYHVSGDSVAWINGLAGGLLTAVGSMSFAVIPTMLTAAGVRVRATVLYMVLSLVNCAALAVLWLGFPSPGAYLAGTVLYLFTIGACYACTTAVILEFLGDAGRSGSTRYSIINALCNLPVQYMILFDGWGGDRFGARGLAGAECVIGALGTVALLVYLLARGPEEPSPLEPEPVKA